MNANPGNTLAVFSCQALPKVGHSALPRLPGVVHVTEPHPTYTAFLPTGTSSKFQASLPKGDTQGSCLPRCLC